jgi:hypothetical protein
LSTDSIRRRLADLLRDTQVDAPPASLKGSLMAELVQIAVSDLLLDGDNARLIERGNTQQEIALILARQAGDHVIKLAADIVEYGMDPTALPAVVATDDRRKRYKVLEGNRRVLALKSLETPALITAELSRSTAKRLNELSAKYAKHPIEWVRCALFEDEAGPQHWIWLRHTGQNDGAGLVTWGSDEQDRYKARHSGKRTPHGQIIDFVDGLGELSPEALESSLKITTNVERLLSNPTFRQKAGLDIVDGDVVSWYPKEEVKKSLLRLVEDLKRGTFKVPDLYTAEQRVAYAEQIPSAARPKRSTRLKEPVVLADLTANVQTPRKAAAKKVSRPRPDRARTTVIPASAKLNVPPPRINAIYNELTSLNAEQYPNACSVLLRVFLELSVDHYIDDKQVTVVGNNPKLATRLKAVGEHLFNQHKIPKALKVAIERVADGKFLVAASTVTFNQYVHNQYVFPKPRELYDAWDELAAFFEKLWP